MSETTITKKRSILKILCKESAFLQQERLSFL